MHWRERFIHGQGTARLARQCHFSSIAYSVLVTVVDFFVQSLAAVRLSLFRRLPLAMTIIHSIHCGAATIFDEPGKSVTRQRLQGNKHGLYHTRYRD